MGEGKSENTCDMPGTKKRSHKTMALLLLPPVNGLGPLSAGFIIFCCLKVSGDRWTGRDPRGSEDGGRARWAPCPLGPQGAWRGPGPDPLHSENPLQSHGDEALPLIPRSLPATEVLSLDPRLPKLHPPQPRPFGAFLPYCYCDSILPSGYCFTSIFIFF